jgi:hypothetical protein
MKSGKVGKQYKYPADKWEKKLSKYWAEVERIESQFYGKLYDLEKKMSKDTGIKDIEFFWCNNSIVGIGNADKTLELIHRG